MLLADSQINNKWCLKNMDKAINTCGKCQQFTRTSENFKDICGAWDQPTVAKRVACDFLSLKDLKELQQSKISTGPKVILHCFRRFLR